MASKSKEFIAKCLSVFNSSGYPTSFKPEYKATWEKYQEGLEQPDSVNQEDRTRVVSVINFIRLLVNAGSKPMKASEKIDGIPVANWSSLYQQLLATRFTDIGEVLVELVRKQGLMRWLKIEKSAIEVIRKPEYWLVQYDVCFMLKKPKLQKLDAVIAELQGFLYKGNIPTQLVEKWRTGGTGHKPKSNLQPVQVLFKLQSNIGRYPLEVNKEFSLFVTRAAGDRLILRLEFKQPKDSILEFSSLKHSDMIKALFKKALLKVGVK